jgi:hypothetical protein
MDLLGFRGDANRPATQQSVETFVLDMHLTHRRIGGSQADLCCGTALLLTPLVSKEPEGTLFTWGDGEQVEKPERGRWHRLVGRLTFNFSNDSPVLLEPAERRSS